MLIEFRVKNYKSFKDEIVLSMETGAGLQKWRKENAIDQNGLSLLKNLVIFGANASGKSNIFKAIKTLRKIVLNPTNDITQTLPFSPFAMSDSNKDEETHFSISFSVGNKIYQYEVAYIEDSITFEKLTEFGTEDIVWFQRMKQGAENAITYDQRLTGIDSILNLNRKNSLFLYDLQKNNVKPAIEVFTWFKNGIQELDSESEFDTTKFKLLEKEKNKSFFLSMMQFTDFNIKGVEVRPAMLGKMQLFVVYNSFDRDGNVAQNTYIPLEEESCGTQKMIQIVLTIIDNSQSDQVLLIDEFDDSFHLALSQALVKLFNSVVNTNQFILTTHELNLLDEKLRDDQIYLVEKEFTGVSRLYSLYDFNDEKGVMHSDIKFFSRYLKGQFGAMPVVDFDGMLQTLANFTGVRMDGLEE